MDQHFISWLKNIIGENKTLGEYEVLLIKRRIKEIEYLNVQQPVFDYDFRLENADIQHPMFNFDALDKKE